jgi:hypothetical protein
MPDGTKMLALTPKLRAATADAEHLTDQLKKGAQLWPRK